MPRLELLGVLILTRLVTAILSSLPEKPYFFYWTDPPTLDL